MQMREEQRLFGSTLMRDNMAPPTSPTLTWPVSRDQLWWQPMMLHLLKKIGKNYKVFNRILNLRILSEMGSLDLDSILSIISLVYMHAVIPYSQFYFEGYIFCE